MSDTPNVLLVVTDQERYDLTAPTGPDVATPAADRLAGEGARFDRAYTPTAICSPARASMETGLYPHNHGVLSNPSRDAIQTALPDDRPTWAQLLGDAGYRVSLTGKWHVDGTTAERAGYETLTGWRHTWNQVIDTEDYREHAREYGVEPTEIETDLLDTPQTAGTVDVPAEATQTGYQAQRAIDRLREYAESGESFVHRLDFPGPHSPYVVPESYVERYDPDDLDPWPTFVENFEDKPAIHEIHSEYYDSEDRTWESWAPVVAHYFAFETLIEEQFARVLDALDECGLAEDTVVVRTSDHGDCVGSHRQHGKGPMMYEDLYHVPFYVRWPGVVEPGSVSDAFVELQDLHPTLCSIGGVEAPDGDGRDLRPAFEAATDADGAARSETVDDQRIDDPVGVPENWRDAAFGEYHGEPETLYTQRMIRTHRYKFVYNGPDVNELYDLREDPHELTNLVDHPEYADVRQDLAERLGEWMERTDDHVNLGRYRNRCVN